MVRCPTIVPSSSKPPKRAWASAQRNRRAHILATTREIIGEDGVESINVRDLAERADVAVQTLYNLLGNRDAIIGYAINEIIQQTCLIAASDASCPNPIAALCKIGHSLYCNHPEYMRQVTLAHFYSDASVYRSIRKCLSDQLEAIARDLQRTGRLRSNVDVVAFAAGIASVNSMTALEWASGQCSLAELYRELVARTFYPMAGAFVAAEIQTLEGWNARQLDALVMT